jgi:hypothetical protein
VRNNLAVGNRRGLAVQDTVRSTVGENDLHDNLEADLYPFSTDVSTVPDVIGDELGDAERKLGVRVLVPFVDPEDGCVESAALAGLVAASDPEAGSELPPGSSVQLWIGIGPGEACDL